VAQATRKFGVAALQAGIWFLGATLESGAANLKEGACVLVAVEKVEAAAAPEEERKSPVDRPVVESLAAV
jgi:hypothetical protein